MFKFFTIFFRIIMVGFVSGISIMLLAIAYPYPFDIHLDPLGHWVSFFVIVIILSWLIDIESTQR